MSNDRPNWLSKWGRSPRQDRRVIENGKFVEQGKIHTPEPPAEVPEQEQSALEIGREPVDVPVREEISGTVFEEARYEPVEQGTSSGKNVQLDGQTGLLGVHDTSSGQTFGEDRQGEKNAVQSISDTSVFSTEGQSVSEVMQAELEPIEVVPSTEPPKPSLIDVGEYEESAEPLTPTTEVGGGYVAIEVDRS